MHDDDAAALRTFLSAQRRCVLEVVDGLHENDMRRTVVPSGWTPLEMIDHLAGAERYWFQHVVAGTAPTSTEPDGVAEPGGGDVIARYKAQVALSDKVLARIGMDARPEGPVPPDMTDEIHRVRDVVLHMIEETARHAGHLDIARELLDGRTGLGPR
jgi:hypothetical protein